MPTFLRNLQLGELSLVDAPANKGAKVAIFKRDFSQEQRDDAADSGAAMPDGSFPIKTVEDLKNAIHAIGRAKDPAAAKVHVISRAKALGATNLLPDGWVSKSASDGNHGVEHMTTEELNKAIADAVGAATADLTKQLKAANDAITKMGANKKPQPADETAEPDGDEATKSAWRAYTAKQVEKAKAEVTKKATEDEVIKVGATEFRKSQTDPATFAIIKAQQVQIAEGVEKAEIADFVKAAEKSYGHLPGETVAKGKALRAVAKLGEDDRKAIEAMLKAGETAMTAALKTKGADTGAVDGSAEAELHKLAKSYAETHKVSQTVALTKVLETDEGKTLYARADAERPRVAA